MSTDEARLDHHEKQKKNEQEVNSLLNSTVPHLVLYSEMSLQRRW